MYVLNNQGGMCMKCPFLSLISPLKKEYIRYLIKVKKKYVINKNNCAVTPWDFKITKRAVDSENYEELFTKARNSQLGIP